jgi:hypothetical protein
MTTGLSGSYAFNGTNLTLQPTDGQWVERTNYGVDGGAHFVYSSVRGFELTWVLISPSDAKQIIDFYNLVGNTGTVVACLPKWGDVDYTFYNYSGTTMQEPSVGKYFMGHIQEVRLLLLNIRTN